jgi:hypothetical protein
MAAIYYIPQVFIGGVVLARKGRVQHLPLVDRSERRSDIFEYEAIDIVYNPYLFKCKHQHFPKIRTAAVLPSLYFCTSRDPRLPIEIAMLELFADKAYEGGSNFCPQLPKSAPATSHPI